MFRGTSYFTTTSLFDVPFSKSFKALHFSAKHLFASFRLKDASFRKKISDGNIYLVLFCFH